MAKDKYGDEIDLKQSLKEAICEEILKEGEEYSGWSGWDITDELHHCRINYNREELSAAITALVRTEDIVISINHDGEEFLLFPKKIPVKNRKLTGRKIKF